MVNEDATATLEAMIALWHVEETRLSDLIENAATPEERARAIAELAAFARQFVLNLTRLKAFDTGWVN